MNYSTAFRRGTVSLSGLVGITLMSWPVEAMSADPVVNWREVQAAVDAVDASAGKAGRSLSSNSTSANSSSSARIGSGGFGIERLGPGLPPPPRVGGGSSTDRVEPASLAGISSSVVPAVTGDLYWSRPVLDMRVIGQSLGHNSALRLSRPPVGVSVGSTTVKPALIGIK